MDGILPLWKPKGMTSHDCVMKIRKIFNTRKVGHTGTLDPNVEGVLAICIGQATKIVPYLTKMKKTYIAECSLGIATETEDIDGKITERKKVKRPISTNEIDRVLQLFKGEITQIPPMYSAVRVKGKRLYEYARDQEQVDRPSRKVTIYEIKNLLDRQETIDKFTIKVTCSSGTYIRTLCVDIGKKLGYPAHMSHLIRVEASSFTTNDTVSFNDVHKAKQFNQLTDLLVPLRRGLNHLDFIQVNEDQKIRVLHGQKLKKPEKQLKTNPFLMLSNEQLLAIYKIHPENPKEIKPIRVFN